VLNVLKVQTVLNALVLDVQRCRKCTSVPAAPQHQHRRSNGTTARFSTRGF
jgi:hypothetical protein